MTFIQAASSTTDSIYSMSHIGSMSRAEIANAIAGVGKAGLVNLQSDVRFNKVRLPKKSDFTLKGLDKVKRYAWLVLLQNGFATFCAGMVIAASFYISLAEVKILTEIREIFQLGNHYRLFIHLAGDPSSLWRLHHSHQKWSQSSPVDVFHFPFVNNGDSRSDSRNVHFS